MKKFFGIVLLSSMMATSVMANCNKGQFEREQAEDSAKFKALKQAGYLSASEEMFLQGSLKDSAELKGLNCGWIKAKKDQNKNACQERAANLTKWNNALVSREITLEDYQFLLDAQEDGQKIAGCKL